jgi:cell wall-associated NlpC family hydrolase
MGSHRARHRADQHQSEELATDLLARLADEAQQRPTPTRHAATRPPLDPFSTAPFPARTPNTGEPSDTPDGAATPTPPEAGQHPLGLRSGPAAELSAGYTSGYGTEPAPAYVPAPRLPADPDAPFPLDDTRAGLIDPPRTGRERLAALGRKPIYAAVSATVITATAAVAASAGPAAVTPPAPTPNRSPSLAAAAMDLAPPAPKAAPSPGEPGSVVALAAGGVAAPAPGQAAAPDAAPVLGSTIVARAAADAKIFAEAQARQAAARAGTAPASAPKPAPKPALKPAPKPAVKPAAAPAPAVGSSVGARALALAKGKVGTPYVWGAAGPSAFDCSGLIVWAYKQLGVSLPHSSSTLSTMGTPVAKAALQPGDLVFFYSPVSHVGIYAGNGMVLNATQSGEPVQFSKLANLPFHNAMRLTK